MFPEKNFVFCVDLDGVVGDYSAVFKKFVAGETGRNPDDLEEQHTWEFAGIWGIRDRQHYSELHTKAVRKGMFADMPLLVGASDALWRLSDEHDVHIRIVTHRLAIAGGHDVVVADTAAWLQRKRPDGRPLVPYRDICFIADKTVVGGDLFIDDAPHNITALQKRGFPTIIMDQPYNRHLDGRRARNWEEVLDMVFTILAEEPRR